MKYYSEKLKKLFDSEDELKKAEVASSNAASAQEKLRKERAEAAKAIDEKYKELVKIETEYRNMLVDFCKKYNKYHKTYTDSDMPVTTGDKLIDLVSDWLLR